MPGVNGNYNIDFAMNRTIKKYKFSLGLFLITGFALSSTCFAQTDYTQVEAKDSAKIYRGGEFYPVSKFYYSGTKETPRNIILLIGDGMGLAHIHAGMTANGGELYLKNFRNIGFTTTFAANKYVTGSAASGTALATGSKTNYRMIGQDPEGKDLHNIREIAQEQGKATGVISTSSVTHATPASFVGHQPLRSMEEEIADDFVNSGIDVFIGGGYDFFTKRKDGRDLLEELKAKGYQIATNLEEVRQTEEGKLAALLAPNGTARKSKRGNVLEVATSTALEILDDDPDGFFLMIEGSQIDWAGHANDTPWIIEEMLDFDLAIGKVLEFAERNQETLVIVTADHETGGLTIEDGNYETGMVLGDYTTGGHTGIMVPVFSFGPGAEYLTGFIDNTDIAKQIRKHLYSSDSGNQKKTRKNKAKKK